MHKTDNDLIKSLENTIGTLQAVLKKTLSHALGIDLYLSSTLFRILCINTYFYFPALSKGSPPSPEQLELRLIQSKRDIENPEATVQCRLVA